MADKYRIVQVDLILDPFARVCCMRIERGKGTDRKSKVYKLHPRSIARVLRAIMASPEKGVLFPYYNGWSWFPEGTPVYRWMVQEYQGVRLPSSGGIVP